MQLGTVIPDTNRSIVVRRLFAESYIQPKNREAKQHFRDWLRHHRRQAAVMSLPEVLRRFGHSISPSAAYRVAVGEGIKGRRHNRTKYDRFWRMLNWSLPDSTLSHVWGVTRGNLRQRRVRLGFRSPAFDARVHRSDSDFRREVAREKGRAARYTGPRPH